MISLGDSIEESHRRLEKREGLTEVVLKLDEHRHSVYLPEGKMDEESRAYLLQRVSSFRWIFGAGNLEVENSPMAQEAIDKACSENGSLAFESRLFSSLDLSPGPENHVPGKGDHFLFFDIGGSSIKGALFYRSRLIKQHLFSWKPFEMLQMQDLVDALETFLKELLSTRDAAAVGHVGISSAGLCRDGALLASTLLQGVTFTESSPYDPWFLKKSVQALFPNAAVQLMNDGEVAALPLNKALSAEGNRIMSLVMGSNLGGGYHPKNQMNGAHEIGFLPVLVDSEFVDTWSGYAGIASEIFSKKGLLRLAKKCDYRVSEKMLERELIDQLHKDLRHGFVKARMVFQALGKMLAPFVAYLERYYKIDVILLSGGILNERVVDEMRAPYQSAYLSLVGETPPNLQMLVVPGISPEFNQVWSMALNFLSLHEISMSSAAELG